MAKVLPHIVDWNNDGKKDVLCGNSYGYVYYLENVNTDADPVFDTAVQLKNGTAILDAGACASPTVVDWNGDGKKDLLCGEYMGRVVYYENKGTDETPVFNGWSYLQAGGQLLDVSYYSRIDLADGSPGNQIELKVSLGSTCSLLSMATSSGLAATTYMSGPICRRPSWVPARSKPAAARFGSRARAAW